MGDDKWLKTALIDDSIVVSLLLRLKHHSYPPLRWGHRQLRSKPMSKDRRPTPTRWSPTTPLSWSANSGSDGCDNTSATRSKGTSANETGTTTTSKKSRKKKNFTDLKEEENYLLNERVHLKKELASIHVTLNEQRSAGDNLKRIKLDFQEHSTNKISSLLDKPVSLHCHQTEASTDKQADLILPRHDRSNDPSSSDSCKGRQKDFERGERCFILPDLNMMPSDE